MGYVFISYSTKNQQQADSMRDLLNRNGIATWMAPYDIPAGGDFLEEIPTAIRNCSCVILMLSKASQDSQWVSKEMERAASYRSLIIPIMIEDMQINDKFSFICGNSQITAIHQIDDGQENVINLITRISDILALTSEQKEENMKSLQNKNEIDEIAKQFYTFIQQLYNLFFEYKSAFRLANQEEITRTSSELQTVCDNVFLLYEKYSNTKHHNIALKACQIAEKYIDYVEKYNTFIAELKRGYSDKSNELALEAEKVFNELENIVKSFL